MRRISWIDQRMRSEFWRCARLGFFGRRLVGLMLDGSHHGKGEHDERAVTMPAVPESGFVVVEPELVFGCLEAILDRPAMALDAGQGFYRSPCRTPGGEVGEIAGGDITPDQQASCPKDLVVERRRLPLRAAATPFCRLGNGDEDSAHRGPRDARSPQVGTCCCLRETLLDMLPHAAGLRGAFGMGAATR